MPRTRDERRLANLAAGQTMGDPCSCSHPRELHQDDWSDALLVGNGACCGFAFPPFSLGIVHCRCRGGDYPRAEDEAADRRAEGAW